MSSPLFVKEKASGKYAFYATLPLAIKDYPHLVRPTVEHYISRLKQPYIDELIEIYKSEIIRAKRE